MSTTARRVWTGLSAFASIEVVGLVLLAPGYPEPGKLYAIGCLSAGFALASGFLAYYPASRAFNTQVCRYAFAASAGLAAYAVAAWALWAAGVPIDIGTVRDGQMARHFWLGPAVLAWAVVAWVIYRKSAGPG